MLAVLLLIIASVNFCQSFTVKAVTSKINDDWSSAYSEIWKILADTLNFKLNIEEVHGELPDVIWDKILKRMENNKNIDVSLIPITILPSTTLNLTYSIPLHRISLSVILRGSANEGVRWKSYLEPFKKSLWEALLTSIVLFTIILTYLWFNENKLLHKFTPIDLLLSEAFICILGASCAQGHPHPPKATSGRIIHLAALVSSVIIVAVYSSSVTAFLTVYRDNKPFSSLDQLLASSKFRIITLDGSPENYFFQESQHESIIEYRTKNEPLTTISTITEALKMTCGKNTTILGKWSNNIPALVISSLWADKALDIAPCILQHIPLNLNQAFWVAFPFSNNFIVTHKNVINKNLRKLIAGGAIVRYSNSISLKAQINREKRSMEISSNNSRDPRFYVSIKDVAPLLALIASGLILAAIILSLEILFHRLHSFFK